MTSELNNPRILKLCFRVMLFKNYLMYHKLKLKFCCQICDVIFPPKTIKTENKKHTIVLNTNFFHPA